MAIASGTASKSASKRTPEIPMRAKSRPAEGCVTTKLWDCCEGGWEGRPGSGLRAPQLTDRRPVPQHRRFRPEHYHFGDSGSRAAGGGELAVMRRAPR